MGSPNDTPQSIIGIVDPDRALASRHAPRAPRARKEMKDGEWEPGVPAILGENPKDAVGSKKPGVSAVPFNVLHEVGAAMTEGALKYGRHNYRVAPIRASVYMDAVFRHLFVEFWERGLDVDPDSGIHPVTKAIAGLMVLRDGILNGTWTDDRPPISAPMPELQRQVDEIHARYPEPKTPLMQKDLDPSGPAC